MKNNILIQQIIIIDNRLIFELFKIAHDWLEEDEEITFWPMLLNPDI